MKSKGTKEIVEYLKSLGSSPYLSPELTWNSSNFEISRIFHSEPNDALSFFLNQKLGRCLHPNDLSKEYLCLNFDNSWASTDLSGPDFTDMLLSMSNSYLLGENQKEILKKKIEHVVKTAIHFMKSKVKKTSEILSYTCLFKIC